VSSLNSFQAIGAALIPGFEDTLKTPLAPPIGLGKGLMGVKKGAAERSHGMDGTPIVAGQESAGTIGPPRRYESGDTDHLALVEDQGAGGGQQVLTCPGEQILARRQVELNAFQIGWDQVTRKVTTVESAFVTGADRAAEAELSTRRIDDWQSIGRHVLSLGIGG
jgi:hypothetical protein